MKWPSQGQALVYTFCLCMLMMIGVAMANALWGEDDPPLSVKVQKTCANDDGVVRIYDPDTDPINDNSHEAGYLLITCGDHIKKLVDK